jgi:ComF family protein
MAVSFGTLMAYAWRISPDLEPVDIIIPVPLHPSSLRERGYNQAALLAGPVAEEAGSTILESALNRIRRTRPQFHLGKIDRLTNVQDAFAIAPEAVSSLKGLQVLLVDDVCTTGATLVECSRILKRAGASGVKALVLARDI